MPLCGWRATSLCQRWRRWFGRWCGWWHYGRCNGRLCGGFVGAAIGGIVGAPPSGPILPTQGWAAADLSSPSDDANTDDGTNEGAGNGDSEDDSGGAGMKNVLEWWKADGVEKVLASFAVALIIGIAIGLVSGSYWGIVGVFLLLLFVRAVLSLTRTAR